MLPRELIEAILTTVGEGIITIDATSTIMLMNPEALTMWGYTAEEIVGGTLTQLMPESYRAAHNQGMHQYLATGIAHVLGRRIEVHGQRKDGTVFPLELHIQETRTPDAQLFTAAVRDLTLHYQQQQRQQAQSAVTTILATTPTMQAAAPRILTALGTHLGWDVVILWQVDRRSGVLRWVQRWQTAELPEVGEALASAERTFLPGEGLPGHIWATGKPRWITDVAKAPNFPRAPLAQQHGIQSVCGVPVTLGNEVLGVLECFSRSQRPPDMDHLAVLMAVGSQLGQFLLRIQAEVEKEHLIAELHQALAARDQFLLQAAHEIRTPLTAAIGYTQLLERRLARANRAGETRLVQVLDEQLHRLQRLIDTMLDLSSLQAGPLPHTWTTVNLAVVVEQTCLMLAPLLERYKLHREIIDPTCFILGDADRLTQVLTNLLQNAMKYSPPDSTISIEVTQEHGWGCIRIRDEGIGIPEAEQPYLFTRFFRATNAQAAVVSGLGVGLALAKAIVDAHHGTIRVDSVEGQGTTITVCLPLISGPLPSSPKAQTAQS